LIFGETAKRGWTEPDLCIQASRKRARLRRPLPFRDNFKLVRFTA
jgi:hypothetical protein